MERRSKGLFNDMNEAFERLKKAQITSLDKKREEKNMVFFGKNPAGICTYLYLSTLGVWR